MRVRRWGYVCLFVLSPLWGASAALGQTNGEIRGVVNDPSGATIPGASVTATLNGTQSSRTATSAADGAFDIPEVAVGTYDVTAEAKGFKKFVARGVVVSIGHVNFLTLTLQIGTTEQTVTVEANAVQVETTSTQIGAVMSSQSIRELPLSTRNAYQLLQLQPGVQSQLGSDLFLGSNNPGVVSVNGGRGRSNNYMVNGGDGNDLFVNGPAIQPSPDAIQEFRVITNTFDAEYGRNSGSVVNVVTKSGTNEVHGDIYEFFRNDVLNTRGYFDPTVAEYRQNQFGGTIGGPIKKDKTFIFASYEGNRRIQGTSSGLVLLPSSDEAGGNFDPASAFQGAVFDPTFATQLANRTTGNTGRTCQQAVTAEGGGPIQPGATYASIFPGNVVPTECFDATALALYKNYVAPYGAGTVSYVPNEQEYVNQFTVRFDHKLTNTQQLSVYYYFTNDSDTVPFSDFQAAGANLPGFGALTSTRAQQWNISHTWTIGSSAVNEFRFNYFREGEGNTNHPLNTLASIHDACGSAVPASNCFNDPANPLLGITTNIPGHMGVPFVSVSGGFVIGNNSEGELPQVGNTFQWTDNFTKTFGSHTVKFGGDVRRAQFNQFLYYNINGAFDVIGGSGGPNDLGYNDNGYADYFLGVPNAYLQGAAQGEYDRNTALYLFAQDSWKLKSNLTLNYGLRWELNTPYYDTENRLQTFRPGQATTQYPCWIYTAGSINAGIPPGDCSENGPNNSVFPLGLVFPGDKGVPRGLTSTYYKAFAPRIGLAWSPGYTEGFLGKLFGGPGKSSIRAGFGIFYNPIEQLVLEQFSAEPPFGGSSFSSYPNFNLPFLPQSSDPTTGPFTPNPFQGIIQQTPTTPCPDSAGPAGCVDWASFRPLLLYGEFAPHLRTQYEEQYNLTIERQLTPTMLFRVAYVGTQSHHLLASHDLDYGYPDTCNEIAAISAANPANVLSYAGGPQTSCGPFGADSSYYILPGTVIPSYSSPQQPFPVVTSTCNGLLLPYGSVGGSNCVPSGATVGPNGLTLVGLRKYSSPNCSPGTGVGCPPDGVPVFSNIFAEDTIANSNYNALQVSVEKSYSHGLMFQASYTYSKAIDQGASFENELNPIYYNATRGDSLLDAKHRFVISPVWDLPIPKFDGFKGKALDGWGASAIIIYQSGFPIRFQDANDQELASSFFFEDANTPYATAPVQFQNPKTNGGIWFNPNNFCDATTGTPCPQVLGTYGNSPHALCCGPAISNTDLVISKKTSISERWNTEFRAEFYNAWNHTQFANPDGNFSDGAAPSGTFGLIQKTREGPRVMQFALKFFF
ncbi:MAG TPA: carboxypeptidase regulatory-like domain-containing protein [Candidatus Acidoferrum sp.]|nr:carboxypeptidase regulatory-like domain-containing protein [Candidatus Acidoferrum sp.]